MVCGDGGEIQLRDQPRLETVLSHRFRMILTLLNALRIRSELAEDVSKFMENDQGANCRIGQADVAHSRLESKKILVFAADKNLRTYKWSVQVDQHHLVICRGLSS